MPMHERPTTRLLSRCLAQWHNMFPTAPTTRYAQHPPIPGGPLVPHPTRSPGYARATRVIPITPIRLIIRCRGPLAAGLPSVLCAGAALWGTLARPTGLATASSAAPSSAGHGAGLPAGQCGTFGLPLRERYTPPGGRTTAAPVRLSRPHCGHGRRDGTGTPSSAAARHGPRRGAKTTPEAAHRRSPSPRGGHGGGHRWRDCDSPCSGCKAYWWSYRTPERCDEPRS